MAAAFNIDKFKHTMRVQVNKLWEMDWNENVQSEEAETLVSPATDESAKVGLASGSNARADFSSATPPIERLRTLQDENEDVLFDREPPEKPPRDLRDGHTYRPTDYEERHWESAATPSAGGDDGGEFPREYNRDTNLLFKPPGPKGFLSLPARFLCASCPKLQQRQSLIMIITGIVLAVVLFILMAFFIAKALHSS